MATWFAPELYYYSGRGFAGGMAVFFGGHWSNPRDQQRMLDLLRQQRVPVAIVALDSYDEFRHDYPLIDEHLQAAYTVAGEGSYGDPQGEYRVLVSRGATPAGTDRVTGLPCGF